MTLSYQLDTILSPTTCVIKCSPICKSILILTPAHTIKSSLFPFAMHEWTQHMLTWHSFYGTVDTKCHYIIMKHEISLKTNRWSYQKINAMQYCISIILEAAALPVKLLSFIVSFQQPVLAITCLTGNILKKRPSLLIFDKFLELRLVPFFLYFMKLRDKQLLGSGSHLLIL